MANFYKYQFMILPKILTLFETLGEAIGRLGTSGALEMTKPDSQVVRSKSTQYMKQEHYLVYK